MMKSETASTRTWCTRIGGTPLTGVEMYAKTYTKTVKTKAATFREHHTRPDSAAYSFLEANK